MKNVRSSYLEKAPETDNQVAIDHAEKSRMLLKMTHDIRTPMHVVQGLASILAKSDSLTPQQKEIATTLESNAGQLFELISNMLDFIHLVIDEPNKELASKIISRP